MPGFRHGAKRGMVLILLAFLVAVFVVRVIPENIAMGTLPPWTFAVAGAAAVFSLGLTVKASKYWSYAYLGGFVIGVGATLFILMHTKFIGIRELLLYGGAAVAAVGLRVKIHL